MKQFGVGHRCDFCGQEIVYLLPDSREEAFGALSRNAPFWSYARRRFAIRRDGLLSIGTARITAPETISTYASIRGKRRCGGIVRPRGSVSAFFSWSDSDWNRGVALSSRASQR